MNEKELLEKFSYILNQVVGFIYPNEIELHWGLLIVLYPYITGLVAGAFILASLVKIFNIKELEPTYRFSLLISLAFLICAPLPLLFHLGHMERSYEMFITPHGSSAMAVFGFVYAWYLAVVLLLEIWFDYRKDIILWAQSMSGIKKLFYRLISLFSKDISEKAIGFDMKAVKTITVIGIPSAFLLHGYVGFIFGSVKANPWWGSVLMPIVFLFSAIVSGIALVMFLYMVITLLKKESLDMTCLNRLADFLFYAVIVDFSLELVDFAHRIYESEESIHILLPMISTRLLLSLVVIQILLGTLLPVVLIAVARFSKMNDELKRIIYFISAILVQIGIFATRWNVVIGGQLFSKSFRGLTIYKTELFGVEGLLTSIGLLILPLFILYMLIKILSPFSTSTSARPSARK